jgi:hypothetical protein
MYKNNGTKEKMDTYSEEYRHDCEVRWLTKLPLETRRKVLGLIEDARGKQARQTLEAELIKVWKNKSTPMML